MSIDCSIIGLPNVGKSTLFNILTKLSVKVANFPFCTIQPNISTVHIPDKRIYQLNNILQSQKIAYDTIRFIDVAGLITGASKGIGIGNQILNCLRTTNILCHVVRCFDNEEVVHVFDTIDPGRDIEVINTELKLFDILQCEKNICILKKKCKVINKEIEEHLFILNKCLNYLYDDISLREVQFSKIEEKIIQKFYFLTIKPVIYIANVDAKSILDDIYLNKLRIFISNSNASLILFSVTSCLLKSKDETVEIIELQKEKILYDIISAVFSSLNLCTFFTVNLNMVRSWIYVFGMTALEASKKIHSDFNKGFIRVQVIKYNDFIAHKGELGAKKFGRIHYEGKNYFIKDGDILKFLFR